MNVEQDTRDIRPILRVFRPEPHSVRCVNIVLNAYQNLRIYP